MEHHFGKIRIWIRCRFGPALVQIGRPRAPFLSSEEVIQKGVCERTCFLKTILLGPVFCQQFCRSTGVATRMDPGGLSHGSQRYGGILVDIRSKSTKQRPCLTVITESISCCHHGNGWMTEPELMIAWFFCACTLFQLEISGKKWNEADPPGIYHLHRFQLILLHFIPGPGMSQDFRYKIDLQPVCVPQLHVPYYLSR